ncbi:MAG: bifunctional demethylmenaquinone methyltransferase/2-methoxy-6-polyprenyl-1,4-benzoquinol methylase UbiE [Verrucomicrobia bacterium]|nr:bifunctional demethylmenaquinone methyltransferase/2-methoxy-6-polyprenyl-1,4-benzoquinol methylase UbiE [Verrucomicrobiota bacterium]
MPEGKNVNRMFANIASRYDFANHFLSGGVDYYWRKVLADRVAAFSPGSLVDLATGSGDVAFKLRDRLGTAVAVRGMDFCEPMLEAAREKKKERPEYADLEFTFGDCMQLPLDDHSVDAVTIAFGVRNFEDRQKGLEEIHRILRPGGRLFILEFSQPRHWFRPFYYLYLKYILPRLASLATGDKSAYDYLAGSIEAFPTRAQLADHVTAAGFPRVTARALTFSIVAIHEATK